MQTRDHSLDFLKIIATILIVFHHYQQITGVVWDNHINFYNGSFYWGYIVELFFVISGYVTFHYIAKIKNGTCFKDFYFKKIRRLLPLVACSAILYEILLYTYQSLYHTDWFGIQINIFGIFIDSLGIQNGWGFSDPMVNYPTWYISVLLLCYIIFFIAIYISKKTNIPELYFYLFLILAGCGITTYELNLPFMTAQTARGYYAFFTGIVLAVILNKYRINYKMILASILSIVTILYMIVTHSEWIPQGLIYILTFILYPAIIIIFQSDPFKKLFVHKFWGIWGNISFNVYIWHNPMFLLMFIVLKLTSWNPDLSKISSMYFYCLIAEIVGLLFYFLLIL